MNSKIELKPTSTIKVKLGIQVGGPVQKFFCNECWRFMGPFVPGGVEGDINKSATMQLDGSGIFYNHPGSHYEWFGKVMGPNIPIEKEGSFVTKWVSPKRKPKKYTGKDMKYKVPGTCSHWDSRMWSSKKDEILQEVQDYVNKGCKK